MLNRILETAATIFTLLGLYFLSEGVAYYGFIINIVGNIIWLQWGYNKDAAGIMFVNIVMVFINLNGLGVL